MFVFLSSEYPPPALLRLFCIRYLRSSGSLHLCAARSIVFCVPVDFKIGGLLELSSSAKKICYSKVFRSDFDTRFFESCRSFPCTLLCPHPVFLCILHASCPVHGFIQFRGVILVFRAVPVSFAVPLHWLPWTHSAPPFAPSTRRLVLLRADCNARTRSGRARMDGTCASCAAALDTVRRSADSFRMKLLQ